MPKLDEKTHIIHLKNSAVIERPMVIIPVEEYEELLEEAEIAQSKNLTKEIESARKNFKAGKGHSLGEVINAIEGRKTK